MQRGAGDDPRSGGHQADAAGDGRDAEQRGEQHPPPEGKGKT